MRNRFVLGGAGVLVLGVLAAALILLQQLPDGPQPVAWDRDACGHCHMHVSDKSFAAQLQTTAGEVLQFDDPGCLLAYLREKRPEPHALWFRHLREDRWIAGDSAHFVPVDAARTPMGYGLGVTDGPDGVDLAHALAEAK